jgi:hypothetical protein
MKYDLIFDAAQDGLRNWLFPASGLLFVAIGIFLWKKRRALANMFPATFPSRDASKFALLFLGFSVLWTTGAFAVVGHDYFALRGTLQNDNAQVVEGRVENFVPMPYAGHAKERFTVCGVPFSYSDYIITGGFNHTSSHGGPIRAGSWVRITHLGDSIARLEIAREDPGEDAKCHRGRRTSR